MRRRKSRPQDRPVAQEFGVPRETSRNRSRSRADAVTSQTAVRACGAPKSGTASAGNVQDTARCSSCASKLQDLTDRTDWRH